MKELNANTFIISDTHFGDYDSVGNGFDKYLVNAWNKTVTENDTVLHLGDFTSDGPAEAVKNKIKKYGSILHGKIFLIRGNHDVLDAAVYKSAGIEIVDDFKNLGVPRFREQLTASIYYFRITLLRIYIPY